MKSYDKAAWHIDAGEDLAEVVSHFRQIFVFLNEKDMLSDDGKETLEFGMDSSVSLNSTMVTERGKLFLDICYDGIIGKNNEELNAILLEKYKKFETE